LEWRRVVYLIFLLLKIFLIFHFKYISLTNDWKSWQGLMNFIPDNLESENRWWILVIVVIIILVGISGYLIYRKKAGDQNKE
ncbi:MAG: hypothetical protein SOX11_13145, partial [Lachnospiraceae bacterium]|nr:hypothetical protein [Lachnospiraceae bacterium]